MKNLSLYLSFLFLLNIAVVTVLLDHHYGHDIKYRFVRTGPPTLFLRPILIALCAAAYRNWRQIPKSDRTGPAVVRESACGEVR